MADIHLMLLFLSLGHGECWARRSHWVRGRNVSKIGRHSIDLLIHSLEPPTKCLIYIIMEEFRVSCYLLDHQ